MTVPTLAEALETLRIRVGGLRLDLSVPGADRARQAQAELVGQVDDYLLPRLRQLDAPLLAVVGGSTGAGKSTLVNTLIGENVSKAGWLRPTTRGPVLVCSPGDLRWFSEDRILPELARTSGDGSQGGGRSLHVVANARVPAGLALLDAPDIDSVVAENRQLAGQLLAAADLWIFCTTAARYADAVPWEMLHTAQQRSTALAVVINRIPPEGLREISSHLAAMLDQNGLARATLFAIPETALHSADDRLPEQIVKPLRAWLDRLAGDADARSEVIRTTLDGALQSVRARVSLLAREVDEQLAAAAVLRDAAEDFYADAVREFDDGIRSGSVLRGEVLSRWQEFVGTGQMTRNLEQRVGRLRDRVTAFITGRQAPTAAVEEALESSVQTLLRAAPARAAPRPGAARRARPAGGAPGGPRGRPRPPHPAPGRTVDAWRDGPAGRVLLADRDQILGHTSGEFAAVLEQEIRAWQGRVLELVAAEGGQKRSMARLASFGTNGAGLVLMLAVFAQTGGLSGVEFLVAGGTSAASQKVLEAVFGDSAVRTLAARARADLLERVELLLEGERRRFMDVVDGAAPDLDSALGLRNELETFEKARRSMRSLTRPGAATVPVSTLGRN